MAKGTRKTKKSKKVHFNSRVTIHKIEKENASDFEDKIKGMNGTILFHHPGCVHCIMLRPKWNQMIQKLKHKNVRCVVLEVNAEALSLIHHPLAQVVHGFPSIVNIENGAKGNVFSEERNVANMLNFVINNLKGKKLGYDYNLNEKNNLVKITDQNNLKKLRNKNKTKKVNKVNKKRNKIT